METIGILGALPEEIRLMGETLQNQTEETVGGVAFRKGILNGKTVILCCAGMGKVNAAAATQLLITYFGAQAIVFSGIAGNMTTKISVGDMVIGKSVLYHDAERRMIAEVYPHLQEYTADAALVAAAEAACQALAQNYIVGRIATGDQFIGDSETKQRIAADCAPDCVEMEGAAVAHVSAKNDVPFVILRAMSDDADEAAYETFVGKPFDISNYCTVSAKICHHLICNI